ncbi:MAG: formate dehydrogenase subunit beta [Paracoccus sp. (in: a-proteobacteria)]|uniref:formate dehydrogenase subunit beta n=2 Tax=Paracoccus TaxID=265 RepID=UPI000C39FD1C|nr:MULTISPECIES: formate dehydrogenase subunit beta [unclassified Paracoccus (in: a-proteobacteria)]MAN55913.1 formate dehydrogenase subunit beta [Paracoccus sp. (in: a-proteobacteria)]MBA48168.1 formate dehydrogenase subunit beta [Paracoccus sp. (in: a-proteobacteria)]|tara:strand:+ start:3301 stop:4266 length:966 start_codon:yes stop_codon:yes gene_type:complete
MTETAPQPTTAAANPPVQPMESNLLPSDVVRASATPDLPQPTRQLTKIAKLIDVSKCIGCKACQAACVEWNDTNPAIGENTGVYENPHDLTPDMFTLMRFSEWDNPATNELEWLIRKDGCMHCEDPGCLKACPAPGAIVQYSNGIVDFIHENCIGCGYCVTGCPFDIPRISKVDNTSYKCTLCSDRVAVGQGPACAKACPTKAIVFGTKEDMVAHANDRVEDLKSRGYENAGIYDPQGVGGTHVFYVLHHADKPSLYSDLPDNPRISPIVEGWKGVTKTAGMAVMGVAAAGAVLMGLFSRNKVEPEEEIAAERLVRDREEL